MAVYAYEKEKIPKEEKEMYESQLRSFYGSLENAVNYKVCSIDYSTVDKGIVDFVCTCNQHGLHTIYSCSGHSDTDNAYVVFATYVTRKKIEHEFKLLGIEKGVYTIEQKSLFQGEVTTLKVTIPPKSKEYFLISSIPKHRK